MMNTGTPALTTADLRFTLEANLTMATNTLKAERDKIAAEASFTYAAQWNVKPAVIAETLVAIYARALQAPAEHTAAALTAAVAEFLNKTGGGDMFANAIAAAQQEAARRALRHYGEFVDARELVNRLI